MPGLVGIVAIYSVSWGDQMDHNQFELMPIRADPRAFGEERHGHLMPFCCYLWCYLDSEKQGKRAETGGKPNRAYPINLSLVSAQILDFSKMP